MSFVLILARWHKLFFFLYVLTKYSLGYQSLFIRASNKVFIHRLKIKIIIIGTSTPHPKILMACPPRGLPATCCNKNHYSQNKSKHFNKKDQAKMYSYVQSILQPKII